MDLTFGPRGYLQIDNARIIYRNFEGRGDKYNREGDRNFAVVIDGGTFTDADGTRTVSAEEMTEILINDVNKYGDGWNVKIKPPRDEDETPFMFLSVKVKFNDRGPTVVLKSGGNVRELNEDKVGMLDHIDIANCDLDIRPYDDEFNGKSFRSAYLDGIHVEQAWNRFSCRIPD